MARTGEVTKPRTLLFSAGDTSGDQHAAGLARALRTRLPDARLFAFGGSALAAAGVDLLEPLADNPVMGFARVLPAIGRFVRLLNAADRWFGRDPPDAVIPVDYPGFNVRLAQLARRRGVLSCYYVLPQYWAWAPWRLKQLAAAVDLGLATLPFEERFFAHHGIDARVVGHPLADRLAPLEPAARDGPAVVGVLPGSRGHEIEQNLPWILAAAKRLETLAGTRLRLLATHPRAERREQIAAFARAHDSEVEVVDQPLPQLLARCRFAFVTSGTATLEAALMRVPSVVLYRVNGVMRNASRFLLLSPWFALPNLLAGHELFPEFLASRDPSQRLAAAALPLFVEGPRRTSVLDELEGLRRRLLVPGTAERAADAIVERLAAHR